MFLCSNSLAHEQIKFNKGKLLEKLGVWHILCITDIRLVLITYCRRGNSFSPLVKKQGIFSHSPFESLGIFFFPLAFDSLVSYWVDSCVSFYAICPWVSSNPGTSVFPLRTWPISFVPKDQLKQQFLYPVFLTGAFCLFLLRLDWVFSYGKSALKHIFLLTIYFLFFPDCYS